MSEIDLIQAYYGAVNLAYTTSTWWLTASSALVVAIYFAAKHIPAWLLAVVLLLYAVTSVSVIYEFGGYSALAMSYGNRLAQLHGSPLPLNAMDGKLNSFANYAVIVLGSISAAAFSFATWRGARRSAAPGA